MTTEAGNANPPLHKSRPRCRRDHCWAAGGTLRGSAGAYLCVCVSDGVIHQHHDQDGDGDPEVSDDPSSLQNKHPRWQREGASSMHPPCYREPGAKRSP